MFKCLITVLGDNVFVVLDADFIVKLGFAGPQAPSLNYPARVVVGSWDATFYKITLTELL